MCLWTSHCTCFTWRVQLKRKSLPQCNSSSVIHCYYSFRSPPIQDKINLLLLQAQKKLRRKCSSEKVNENRIMTLYLHTGNKPINE